MAATTNQVSASFIISNKLGLHARAATQLAKLAMSFDSEVTIKQGDKSAQADSVLGLMLLESSHGKQIEVICEGDDANSALAAIGDLINAKFNEAE